MLDKQTREVIRFIRDLQGTSKYKGRDKLSSQFIQADIQKRQGFKVK